MSGMTFPVCLPTILGTCSLLIRSKVSSLSLSLSLSSLSLFLSLSLSLSLSSGYEKNNNWLTDFPHFVPVTELMVIRRQLFTVIDGVCLCDSIDSPYSWLRAILSFLQHEEVVVTAISHWPSELCMSFNYMNNNYNEKNNTKTNKQRNKQKKYNVGNNYNVINWN